MTGGRTRHPPTLAEHLRAAEGGGTPLAPNLVAVLEALAAGGVRLAREIAGAALVGGLGETGDVNSHGDRVRARILDVVATDYHQRTPLYIGSAEEVAWAERCYREARA